jgi:serine/threonine-protein kinase RsbW
MAGRTHSLLMPAALAEVAGASRKLRSFLPERMTAQQRDEVELGITEALTNIVRHGFAGQSGSDVSVSCSEEEGGVALEIRDCGHPIPADKLQGAGDAAFDFDPTDLAGLPEDGLGLSLIKAAFDEVSYSSEGGTNILVLRKRLPPAARG